MSLEKDRAELLTLDYRGRAAKAVALERICESVRSRPCGCADWEPGTAKINDYIKLQFARTGRDTYDGIPFKYCPWCGGVAPSKDANNGTH